MDDLQKALALLEKELGPCDNIKFLLDDGEAMTREKVDADFLKIAEGLRSGVISTGIPLCENKLKGYAIAL